MTDVLKEKLIGKSLANADPPIAIDRSRCMRMRFNKNECSVCTSNCHAGAITIKNDILIDAEKCTLCMVCISECPSDCFDIHGGDFFSILARLKRVGNSGPSPVLGCNSASDANAHEKMSCLGALSEEHLIAINAFMDKPLQLNLSSCTRCNNSFVIDKLKKRVAGIKDAAGIDVSEKTALIENKAHLRFDEVSYDRRGFFSAVRNMAFIGASGFFESNRGDVIQSYSQKRLSQKRTILNAVLEKSDDKEFSARILRGYAFSIKADASCDNCYSCVGMCPTGALKSKRDGAEAWLLFNSSMCNGCALCRDFCFNDSIAVLKGYSGDNYFEYETCNKDSSRADATEDEGCEYTADAVCCNGQ